MSTETADKRFAEAVELLSALGAARQAVDDKMRELADALDEHKAVLRAISATGHAAPRLDDRRTLGLSIGSALRAHGIDAHCPFGTAQALARESRYLQRLADLPLPKLIQPPDAA